MAQRTSNDPNRFAQELFTPLPRRYDALAELLSMGQNRRWRRQMVERAVAEEPNVVLDVACGPGGEARLMATCSTAQVVGIDLTEAMVHQGRRKVAEVGLDQRVKFMVGQAERLPFPDRTFDALTFTYLLRYVEDPQATLRELARVLKPGAVAASMEFFVPPNRLWRAAWWLYTRGVLPVAGGLTGGRDWYQVGRFLGPNITRHYHQYPLGWTVAAWQGAGFCDIGVRTMSLGGGLVMWGRRGGS